MQTDRVPPHDTDAEQATLGAMLIEQEAAERALGIVQPADFYREAHRNIAQAAADVYHRREPVDMISVAAELRRREQLEAIGGGEYLTALINKVPTAAHVSRYATIVAEKAILRRVITEAARAQDEAYGNPANVGQVLNRTAEGVHKIMAERLASQAGLRSMLDRADAIIGRVDRAARGVRPLSPERLGLRYVDEMLGPLSDQRLCVLKADSGKGKTQLSVNAVYSSAKALWEARDNRWVVVFNLEAPGIYEMRGLSWESYVDSMLLQRGFDGERNPDFADRLYSAAAQIANYPIAIMEDNTNEDDIEAQLRIFARKHTPALVVLDHWQEMARRSRRTGLEELEASAGRWKDLSIEFGCPFLILSQVTYNKDTGNWQAQGSRKIEQVADLCMLLHEKQQKEAPPTLELVNTKIRWGLNFGAVPVHVDKAISHVWTAQEYADLTAQQEARGREYSNAEEAIWHDN